MRLTVDEIGLGTGTMAAAARVKPDGSGGVVVEDYADEPIKLTFVTRVITVTRLLMRAGWRWSPRWRCRPRRPPAQETRADAIAEAQAAKAGQLGRTCPARRSGSPPASSAVSSRRRTGFYPWFDSVYSGGGFTLGAGYRTFYGDRTFCDARGLLLGQGLQAHRVRDRVASGSARAPEPARDRRMA